MDPPRPPPRPQNRAGTERTSPGAGRGAGHAARAGLVTWHLFGDWRGLLQGPWAGSIAEHDPQLGAGVEQQSIFLPRLAAAYR